MTSHTSEWEKEAREFWGFMETPDDFINFLRKNRTASFNEGVKKALEVLDSMKRRHYKEASFLAHRNDSNDAYNYVVEDMKEAITALLTK